jgi:hypothetical protein
MFCLTALTSRPAGEGQAGGGGDALHALQVAPDLWLPHQAGGARHQRGQGQACRHLRVRDEGAPKDLPPVRALWPPIAGAT